MTNAELETEEIISIADGVGGGQPPKQSFVPVQLKPNPNQKSFYKVLESPGLRSHFRSVQDEPFFLSDNAGIDVVNSISKRETPDDGEVVLDDFKILNLPARSKREVDNNDEKEKSKDGVPEIAEALPSAEPQVMEPAYFRQSRSRSFSGDSVAQPSMEIGIKSRMPRVNFITQPRSLTALEIPEHRDLSPQSSMTRNPDPIYKKPYDMHQPPPYYNKEYSRSGYYDDYQPMDRYDRYSPPQDYYNRNDPYYYRQPMNPYYNNPYTDRRYEYPEMRNYNNYPPPYMNDVGYMPPPPSNRRVIYYATLPEVVRTPEGDSRYRTYKRLDDDYYYRPDDYNRRYYRNPRDYLLQPMPPVDNNQNSNRGIEERDPKSETKKDDKTQTVSSNIRVQDNNNNNKSYRGYSSGGSTQNQGGTEARNSDFTKPHY